MRFSQNNDIFQYRNERTTNRRHVVMKRGLPYWSIFTVVNNNENQFFYN